MEEASPWASFWASCWPFWGAGREWAMLEPPLPTLEVEVSREFCTWVMSHSRGEDLREGIQATRISLMMSMMGLPPEQGEDQSEAEVPEVLEVVHLPEEVEGVPVEPPGAAELAGEAAWGDAEGAGSLLGL